MFQLTLIKMIPIHHHNFIYPKHRVYMEDPILLILQLKWISVISDSILQIPSKSFLIWDNNIPTSINRNHHYLQQWTEKVIRSILAPILILLEVECIWTNSIRKAIQHIKHILLMSINSITDINHQYLTPLTSLSKVVDSLKSPLIKKVAFSYHQGKCMQR